MEGRGRGARRVRRLVRSASFALVRGLRASAEDDEVVVEMVEDGVQSLLSVVLVDSLEDACYEASVSPLPAEQVELSCCRLRLRGRSSSTRSW